MGWNRKEGSGNKDFKKGGQAGSRGGCLKKGGTGTPLRTMIQFLQSSEPSLQSLKKHTDQRSKNKAVTEGIPERDLQNFRLVRLVLDTRVQVSAT